MLNRRPKDSLCWLICYILSATSQVPKLHRGSRGPPRPGVAFPTTSRLQLSGTLLATPLAPWNQNSIQLARRTQPSYIIVRRPLDLWNRMFNRHQAEITVMQFRGHSFPVDHSVVYHGNFFFLLVPFHQQISTPTRFPLIIDIRMCHLLPVHHLGMAFLAGSKGQNTTKMVNFTSSSTHHNILSCLFELTNHQLNF